MGRVITREYRTPNGMLVCEVEVKRDGVRKGVQFMVDEALSVSNPAAFRSQYTALMNEAKRKLGEGKKE